MNEMTLVERIVLESPPPDGGRNAWLCVFGTHLVVMNTWGMVNSFGAFQSYYASALNQPPSAISWVGSAEVFLLLFVGAFTGRLTDAGFFRTVATTGAILVVLGTLTASICSQYWQVFLAQGVCVGLGNGCLFCPTIAIVSTYFSKRRSLTIGMTACGSGTGGVVFPLLIRELLRRVGFSWSLRVIGFIQAGSLAIALLCLKPRTQPRKTGQLVELAAFREVDYTLFSIGCFLCYWGSYFAFFFVAAYARDVQGMAYPKSLELVMIMNGVGTIGRILPNYLADRVGPLTMFVPAAITSGILMFCWVTVSSSLGLYIWASLAGVALGAIQALFPSASASFTTDMQKQGTRIGMVFKIVSFSVLTGPPIAGALLSELGGRYIAAQVFAGTSLSLGTVSLLIAREVKRRRMGSKFWTKV